MLIDIDIIDIALDSVFNGEYNSALLTYKLRLKSSSGVYESTIDFNVASNGVVQMSSPVYYAIPSGITISGIIVFSNEDSKTLVDENLTGKTFTSNGTYTVSSSSISLGV